MKLKIFNESQFELPEYKTEQASGMDMRAWLSKFNSENIEEFLENNTKGEVIVTYNTDKTVMVDTVAAHPVESIILNPGATVIIPSGIHVELPDTHELVLRPKSGQSFKKRFTLMNSPATIDSDYIGDIATIVGNLTPFPIPIFDGERVCQMIIQEKAEQVEWESVRNLSDLKTTIRGEKGFGSTGTK